MTVELPQRKICMLGDISVGKTSLTRRFVYNRFESNYLATIGVQVSRKEVALADSTLPGVSLVVWDIAGGDTITRVEESYFRGSAGALLVADITRRETANLLNTYATSFKQINPAAAIVFAFNKIDLVHNPAEVEAFASSQAARWQAPWFFTSALIGAGVEEAFAALAGQIMTGERGQGGRA